MPLPRLNIAIDLPPPSDRSPDLRALPTRPGVFALEDERERTILIGTTADLRRQVRTRLAPNPEGARSRRVEYHEIARRVRATTVGSAFEADWAYLELARRHLPVTFRSLFDRWRGWFVSCDPDASFPRFVKTSTTDIGRKRSEGVHLGPFSDKHDAQRAIERLESGFDLCRYHHILIEAPHASACAYKEMGKCPAPCDGSITMDDYREMMRGAIAFAADARRGRVAMEAAMQAASENLDFEKAERCRQRLEALAIFERPAFSLVHPLHHFRFVAILPAESNERARIMTISGGQIEPWADVPLDATANELSEVLDALEAGLQHQAVDLSPAGIDAIGLVCWHLFRPAKARGRAHLVPAGDGIDRRAIQRALKQIRKGTPDAEFERETDAG